MNRSTVVAVLACLALAGTAVADPSPDPHRVGQAVADELAALHGPPSGEPRPQALDTTDFAGQTLGCITLARWEMRRLRYPGHAFACEDAASGEVLGAVLTKSGNRKCLITGQYAGNDCYDLVICEVTDRLCKTK